MGSGVSVAQEANNIGNDAFKQKDFRHAVEAYSRAIEEDDNDPKLYSNRAAAYLGEGRHGFAYYDALRSAALNSDWPKAYFRMGQALLELGARDLAVEALRTCAALAPGDSTAERLLREAEAASDYRGFRGYLLSWGSDEHSCLGHRRSATGTNSVGGRCRESAAPRPVEDFKTLRITDVACGVGHSVAIDNKGHAYAWGLNSTSQCGDVVCDSSADASIVPVPTLLRSLVTVQVVAIACGAGHSVVLTDCGVAYAWGLGANGQLGLGETLLATYQTPQMIETLKEFPIVGVACGFAHTMLVDKESQVFACGWNFQGQVGIRDPCLNKSARAGPIVPTPSVIPEFSLGVKHVACGGVHTAVVFSDTSVSQLASPSAARQRNTTQRVGTAAVANVGADTRASLWCFGANSCGQLGLNSHEDALAPTRVALPASAAVALAVCGEEYAFAISDKRDVYGWGLNNVGQLGLPVTDSSDLSNPRNYVLQPTHVSALLSAHVEWIVCGQGRAYGVTKEGAVWAWGLAELGDGIRSPEPLKGFHQHEVTSIVAGRNHFCAMCRAPLASDADLALKSTVAGLRVGRRIEFELTLHTQNGDVWRINSAGQPITVFVINEDSGHGVKDTDVFDNMDGTLGVSFKTLDAGAFRLHCLLAREHVRGSPYLVEVEAGTICLEKCVCTLQAVRRVRCGDEAKFYVVARDAQENYVYGGRQRASVNHLEGGDPALCVVEDAENGQSRFTLRWDSIGARRLGVSIGDEVTPVEQLKCCIVEVTPGKPSPPHFILENADIDATAGVPYECGLILSDSFGNHTDELLDDLKVYVEGPQVGVAVNIRPPLALSRQLPGGEFAAWSPPALAQCRLGLSMEVGIAGSYHVVWTSDSAGSGRATFCVRSGPPDLLACMVTGVESRTFQPGPSGQMEMEFIAIALDQFGNQCDAHNADISMRFKRWGSTANVLQPWQDLSVHPQGNGQFAAVGQADTFGEWHLEVRVCGKNILGSPFVIHIEEDLAEIRRREEEEKQRSLELERERREQQKQAEAERLRKLQESRNQAEMELNARMQLEAEEKNRWQENNETEKELERRRKIYDRLKREEEVRKRAEEVLRKEIEERRNRMKKEKEKKEKRCGGGFSVVFRETNRSGHT